MGEESKMGRSRTEGDGSKWRFLRRSMGSRTKLALLSRAKEPLNKLSFKSAFYAKPVRI
jgi:hypothetical protein